MVQASMPCWTAARDNDKDDDEDDDDDDTDEDEDDEDEDEDEDEEIDDDDGRRLGFPKDELKSESRVHAELNAGWQQCLRYRGSSGIAPANYRGSSRIPHYRGRTLAYQHPQPRL